MRTATATACLGDGNAEIVGNNIFGVGNANGNGNSFFLDGDSRSSATTSPATAMPICNGNSLGVAFSNIEDNNIFGDGNANVNGNA